MKQPEAADEARVGQVGIELVEIETSTQGLVDDGRRGKRDEEQVLPCVGPLELVASRLFGSIELGVERGVVAGGLRPLEGCLHDHRAARACIWTEDVEVAGHVAVAEHWHPKKLERRLEHGERSFAASGIGREEQGREGDGAGLVSEGGEGNVRHHARTVAASAIRPHRAAVLDLPQCVES